jgi:hypothetical protein
VPVKAGRENVRVVYSYRDGSRQIVACQRYDRFSDSFIDVDPADLGIEE